MDAVWLAQCGHLLGICRVGRGMGLVSEWRQESGESHLAARWLARGEAASCPLHVAAVWPGVTVLFLLGGMHQHSQWRTELL